MQIADIHNLTTELIDADGDLEFEEEGTEREEFAEALAEMAQSAGEDYDALYTFFQFATDQKGSTGADYNWDSKEFKEQFDMSFRGADRTPARVIREYFKGYDSPDNADPLVSLASDTSACDYFQWEQYVKEQRSDLTLIWRGPLTYLFEGE